MSRNRTTYATSLGRRLGAGTDGDPRALADLLGVKIEDLGSVGSLRWAYVPPPWVPHHLVALRSGEQAADERDLARALAHVALEHDKEPIYTGSDSGSAHVETEAGAEAEVFVKAFLLGASPDTSTAR